MEREPQLEKGFRSGSPRQASSRHTTESAFGVSIDRLYRLMPGDPWSYRVGTVRVTRSGDFSSALGFAPPLCPVFFHAFGVGLSGGCGHGFAASAGFDFGNGICLGGFWRTASTRHSGYGGDNARILGRSALPLQGSLKSIDGAIESITFRDEKSDDPICWHTTQMATIVSARAQWAMDGVSLEVPFTLRISLGARPRN